MNWKNLAVDTTFFVTATISQSELAVWKEQARALGIVSEAVLRAKIEYVHKNPVSRKLVDDPSQWPWSSWRNYHLDDDSVLRVDRVKIL